MRLVTVRTKRFLSVLALASSALVIAPISRCAAQEEARPAVSGDAQSESSDTSDRLRETDIPAMPGMRVKANSPSQSPDSETPPSSASQATTPSHSGGLTYTVRSGDYLSEIAELYGLDVTELGRANHLGEDAVLRVGQTLQIPNPFAAQVRHLQDRVQQLSNDADTAQHQAQANQAKIQSLNDQVEQLRAGNSDLQHSVRALPWWRGLALSAGAAALLMLGITALTMLEWLMLRRRFRALVEMNEAVRRLDQKYKVALAKAELRLQQLYGRRRVPEDQEMSKSPEQIEIDRLNQQLKELLEEQLEKLGFSAEKARRRNRLRDLVTGVESPVEARASRR